MCLFSGFPSGLTVCARKDLLHSNGNGFGGWGRSVRKKGIWSRPKRAAAITETGWRSGKSVAPSRSRAFPDGPVTHLAGAGRDSSFALRLTEEGRLVHALGLPATRRAAGRSRRRSGTCLSRPPPALTVTQAPKQPPEKRGHRCCRQNRGSRREKLASLAEPRASLQPHQDGGFGFPSCGQAARGCLKRRRRRRRDNFSPLRFSCFAKEGSEGGADTPPPRPRGFPGSPAGMATGPVESVCPRGWRWRSPELPSRHPQLPPGQSPPAFLRRARPEGGGGGGRLHLELCCGKPGYLVSGCCHRNFARRHAATSGV